MPAAKAVLGGVLAVLMSVVTLALNRALGSDPLALLVALLVAGAVRAAVRRMETRLAIG